MPDIYDQNNFKNAQVPMTQGDLSNIFSGLFGTRQQAPQMATAAPVSAAPTQAYAAPAVQKSPAVAAIAAQTGNAPVPPSRPKDLTPATGYTPDVQPQLAPPPGGPAQVPAGMYNVPMTMPPMAPPASGTGMYNVPMTLPAKAGKVSSGMYNVPMTMPTSSTLGPIDPNSPVLNSQYTIRSLLRQ